ncbi:class I SAM-dependent methyltransferase [Alkalihalobacillus sp. AL-G]|uniref:class I SAM-dependent methyltransferase n=1 Tax=Alkalihalobacillus sp. AL-G TaxID=2926399 RepID=UPI00272C043B|nr:class I SAM-dependent methyltransferase [Alkalihalobacillus sp. AL-G]WLD93881.1 class I SAM-dependent methyltransferase [Alkalihalobacillus sp. AL-G]
MHTNKFSVIAHRNHEICNPISKEKLMNVIDKVQLDRGQAILDVGAGKCDVLIQLVRKYGVIGTAVEIEEAYLNEAKGRTSDLIDSEQLSFIQEDAKQVIERYKESFDMAICLGATHALGDYRSTLEQLSETIKPGGYLLIGEGYWKRKPDPDYLEALGAEEEELLTHYENIALAEQLDLIPMWASVTSEDEWDAYEWLYSSSMERYCLEHPEDPDVEWMNERIRKWRSTYLRWGRDTLGFGLYLFQVKKV